MGSTFKNNSISVQPLDCSFIATDCSIIPTKSVWNLKQTANLEQIANYSVAFSQPTELLGFGLFLTLTSVIFGGSILITEYMTNRSRATSQSSVTATVANSADKSLSVKDTGSSAKGPQKVGGSGDGDEEKQPVSQANASHRVEFITLQELIIWLNSILERKTKKVSQAQCLLVLRSLSDPEYKKRLEELGITIIPVEHQMIYNSTDPALGDNVLIVHDCLEGYTRWVVLVQHNNSPNYLIDNSRPIRDRVRKYIDALQSHRGSVAASVNDVIQGEGPSVLGPPGMVNWLQHSAALARRPSLYPQPAPTELGLGATILGSMAGSIPNTGHLTLNFGGPNLTSTMIAPHNQNTTVDQAAGAPAEADQDLLNVQSNPQNVCQSNSPEANLAVVENNTAGSGNPLLSIAAGILAAGGAAVLINILGAGMVTVSRRRVNRQLGMDRGQQDFFDAVTEHNSGLNNIFNQIKLPAAIPVVPNQPLAIENSIAFQEGQNEGFLETQRDYSRQHSNQRARISRLNQSPNSSSSGQRPPRGVSPAGVTMGVLLEIFSLVLHFVGKKKQKK